MSGRTPLSTKNIEDFVKRTARLAKHRHYTNYSAAQLTVNREFNNYRRGTRSECNCKLQVRIGEQTDNALSQLCLFRGGP